MNAQITDGCPPNSSYVAANCGSGCYSVRTIGAGTITDIVWSAPTKAQKAIIREDLNRRCGGVGTATQTIAS